jgi:quercetin dioxygenase-like cupin family protein
MNSVQVAAAILGILTFPRLAQTTFTVGELSAQEMAGTMQEHLTGVSCDDVPPGQKRPEFGCFNIATEKGLQFEQSQVYWHIRTFANRATAEAAKSTTGIVVEEDGRVWLSEFGPRDLTVKGGRPVAVVGPLELAPAKSYTAVLSYAVMRPGDRSRVHTHPGPEGWYMLVGEQCLETPAGANRAKAGGTMTVPPNVPMELSITGTVLRKSLVLVIHDSSQPRGTPSQWKPTGACGQ